MDRDKELIEIETTEDFWSEIQSRTVDLGETEQASRKQLLREWDTAPTRRTGKNRVAKKFSPLAAEDIYTSLYYSAWMDNPENWGTASNPFAGYTLKRSGERVLRNIERQMENLGYCIETGPAGYPRGFTKN